MLVKCWLFIQAPWYRRLTRFKTLLLFPGLRHKTNHPIHLILGKFAAYMKIKTVEDNLEIDSLPLKKATLLLRAINHPLRQQILQLIHNRGRITVTELYNKLHMDQPVTSQHLAILRRAGFVSTTRDGKFIYYSVNYDRMIQVHDFSESISDSKNKPSAL